MDPMVMVTLLLLNGSMADELKEICGRPIPEAAAARNLDDRYTIFFSEVGQASQSVEIQQTFKGMSQTVPHDRAQLLANRMKEAGLANCALLDALHKRYDQDAVTGCDAAEQPDCELTHVQAEFARSWAAMPKERREQLTLREAKPADLSIVATAPIESLDISNSPAITSLAPLSNMKSLRRLIVSRTGITDLAGMKGLESLEKLELVGNEFKSLAGINSLRGLRSLDVSNSGVVNLSGVSDLKALKYLSVSKAVTTLEIDALKKANPKLSVSQY